MNPNLAGEAFASKALAGVGVAFYVMAALTRALRERGTLADPAAANPADLLDLVALGTVADVVPLDVNNRILVSQGLRRITHFDASDFPTQITGEVPDFIPEDWIEFKEIKKMDRFIQFAVAAAQMAMDVAALSIKPEEADRAGVIIGSGIGGLPAIEHYHKVFLEKGPRRITPFFIPMLIINLAAGQISIRFGAKGPNVRSCDRLCNGQSCHWRRHEVGPAGRRRYNDCGRHRIGHHPARYRRI